MTDVTIPSHNTGVILGSGTENLWVGGTIPYEVRLESGDWRPLAPVHEKQKDPLETMACVTFSCLNTLELQYALFGEKVNFSDRFLAKMSGTTPNGNYLDRVADTARTIGLVDESVWANQPKATTWAQYYAEIPQEIKNKAVKQAILYEGVTINVENLKKHLKQSPIQIVITSDNPRHAVTLVCIEGTDAYYLDHYNYQIKKMSVTKIASALKIVLLKPTPMTNSLLVENGAERGLYLPATSEDGLITLMRNLGHPVPLKPDGKLDWDKVKFTHKLIAK